MTTKARATDPAPKYSPTGLYGSCEAPSCTSDARTTCPSCAGEFCFGHAAHEVHATAEPAGSEQATS